MRCFLILLLGSALGCAGALQVQTDYSEATDFTRLQSFAWQASEIGYAADFDAAVVERLDSDIRTTVVETLTAKGYTRVPADHADFWVSYHVVVTQEEDPLLSYEKRVSTIFGGDRDIPIYREDMRIGSGMLTKGTLILFLVDPASRALLWQAVAADTLSSTDAAMRVASRAVRQMLDHFPPG